MTTCFKAEELHLQYYLLVWGYYMLNKHSLIPRYAGRSPAAAVATGNKAIHYIEQNKLIEEALRI